MSLANRRFLRLALPAALAFFGLSLTAHAVPVVGENFSISGTDGQLTGTVTVNFGSGITTGSYTYNDGTNNYTFTGADASHLSTVGMVPNAYDYIAFLDGSGNYLWVAFNAQSYAGDFMTYADTWLCSLAHPCSDGETTDVMGGFGPASGGDLQYFNKGSVHVTLSTIDVAQTPEPSSFALLGTGALGVFGTMRRRILRRA